MANANRTERINTVVVGAGQAGLSVGYHLQRRGVPFVMLDANARVGDVWRRRWDSLRLFTPGKFSSLDGWPFPAIAITSPRRTRWATTSRLTLATSVCRSG